MRIAVVGSGYVGLVTGACFAELGHEVVLVDNDEKKIAALRNDEVPIHERFLPELLARHRGQRIKFSGDLQAATRESEVVFIAVGTPPTESGDADLSYVESVAREISGGVDEYKVVVEKSTVPVYTSQWIRTIIIRDGADPATGSGQDTAAVDRHEHEERGTDQARFQCVSGDEDFLYQCGGVDLRVGGSECGAGERRDRDGFADRVAIYESGDRVRRVVLSQRPDGVSGGREGKRIRLPAAGRSDSY